jgi:Family of unknown function (DUF6328)
MSRMLRTPAPGPPPEERVDIGAAVSHALEEARMVIPGVQALFGFQFVIVFQDRFAATLTPPERIWHLVSVGCSILALLLLLTPAVLHRERESGWATQGLLNAASRLLWAASIPLALALAIDFGLVARVVTGEVAVGIGAAVGSLVIAASLWYVLPQNDGVLARLRR